MDKKNPRFPCTGRLGFTLIELLTVIAIIGILAAIIIPVTAKVRKTAKNAQCVGNLRQWSQAVLLYANDHKGHYIVRGTNPAGVNQTWVAVSTVRENMHYGAYLEHSSIQGNLRRCPLDEPDVKVSYLINRPMIGNSVSPANKVPLYRATNPSRLLLFIDVDSTVAVNNTFSLIGKGGLDAHVVPLFSPPKDRHGAAVNAVFADGHTAKVTRQDIEDHGAQWMKLDS